MPFIIELVSNRNQSAKPLSSEIFPRSFSSGLASAIPYEMICQIALQHFNSVSALTLTPPYGLRLMDAKCIQDGQLTKGPSGSYGTFS